MFSDGNDVNNNKHFYCVINVRKMKFFECYTMVYCILYSVYNKHILPIFVYFLSYRQLWCVKFNSCWKI